MCAATSWRLIKALACDSPLNLPPRCNLSLMDSSRERRDRDRERARMRKVVRAETRSSNNLCGVVSINRSWDSSPQTDSRFGPDRTRLYSLRDNDYQWREIHGSAWVYRRVMGRYRPMLACFNNLSLCLIVSYAQVSVIRFAACMLLQNLKFWQCICWTSFKHWIFTLPKES